MLTGAALAAVTAPASVNGQAIGDGYMQPPAPIPQILDAEPTPFVTVAPGGERLAILTRDNLPTIAELSEPELRLAGMRINPRTSGPSRERFMNGVTFQSIADGSRIEAALPVGVQLSDPAWSPDGTMLAVVNTTAAGLELWVVDASDGAARRITDVPLNGTLGSPFTWMPDGRSLLVKLVPVGRGAAAAAPAVPTGPVIQQNLGREAPGRTYQDLLQNAHDEALFEYYFTAQPAIVGIHGGQPALVGDPGIASVSPAPGGEYFLVERLHRPFSYLVPLYRFPTEVLIVDRQGNTVRQIADLPLTDEVPIAFDATTDGPRSFQWRADAPATLVWVEALDGGDPRNEAEFRDRVLLLDAPFTGDATPLIDLEHRYGGIQWGRDDFAIVYSRWWDDRNERRYAVQPNNPAADARLLVDRSYDDRYGDPGSPEVTRNDAGRAVLLFSADGQHIYLTAQGASPRGNYPFLDRMNIGTGDTERLWQAEDPYYEDVVTMLAADGSRFLTRRETLTEPPNYYLRDLNSGSVTALTDFPDPAPQLAGIQRELITYERDDGITLSATLYTPPGYDAARDGPLPMLMWAYPREFRDADAAAQVSDSPNRFSRPGGSSHLFLLTQGYAILDGPTMPIIGEGDERPNDRYVEQLVSSAGAAVDKVVEMGVAERNRIGIGGHSYGAFMTGNLLAHSDLFAAGIARSGAYNRTLTPFGFQAEQRTYWEAPEVYFNMSPFMHADRIEEPILLIHGAADNNSGTFPVQSERFYAALKGHGATVRYVVLPHESHGYSARESVGHTLAEMVDWMDRYVKNVD
jgi:dipeptidyl aminopeptidase/acylaminoacyl peptidase